MGYTVRVNPVFYARLKLALDQIGAGLDTELEIVGSELASIEAEFANNWSSLPEFKGYRFVTREVSSIPAIVFVAAKKQTREITIWNLRIVENPFPEQTPSG